MTPSGRADAIYNAIENSSAHFSEFSVSEKAALKAQIQQIFGDDGSGNGDLTYIQGNADVLPASHSGPSLNNPAGQPVATTGTATAQSGFTTAPETIDGMGSVQ